MKPSHDYKLESDPLAAVITFAIMLLALIVIALSAGCAGGVPEIQVQRAWGTGGVELTVDGTPVFLEVEEAGTAFSDGELGSCTSVVASVAGAVAEGVVTEISDARCISEAGMLPFGLRRVLLVRAGAPGSTGTPSGE